MTDLLFQPPEQSLTPLQSARIRFDAARSQLEKAEEIEPEDAGVLRLGAIVEFREAELGMKREEEKEIERMKA